MLGLKDFWVSAGFLLMILSAILCVVYGFINWNKGGDIPGFEKKEEAQWAKDEAKLEKNI
ncbi:MAG: hypothetical protein PHF84_12190 [bacterium]|nr:hypothetical protein [bacterium]